MKNVAMVTGLLLTLIGLVCYSLPQVVVTEGPSGETVETIRSWTELIPTLVGVPLFLCGLWAKLRPASADLAIRLAAVLGLVGTLVFTVRGVIALWGFVRATEEFNQRSFAFIFLSGVLCWMWLLFWGTVTYRTRKARSSSAT